MVYLRGKSKWNYTCVRREAIRGVGVWLYSFLILALDWSELLASCTNPPPPTFLHQLYRSLRACLDALGNRKRIVPAGIQSPEHTLDVVLRHPRVCLWSWKSNFKKFWHQWPNFTEFVIDCWAIKCQPRLLDGLIEKTTLWVFTLLKPKISCHCYYIYC